MDNMINQMRVKFAGVEEIHEGETSHVRDRKSPTQTTRSFKGDSRRGEKWQRGQSSREVTYDYDSDYMESDEFRTAVAAAAFAIDSFEERRRTRRRRDGSLSKPKTKPEADSVSATASRKIRERTPSSSSAASNKMKMKNKEDDTVPISTPSFLSRKISELQEKMPQRANSPANTGLKPDISSNDTKPTNTATQTGISEANKRRTDARPEDIKAEGWEKIEMERIKDRYERLMAKILEWENEKKAKAHKKLSRHKDDESEKKRDRALRNYKTDVEMIEQIAEGARSQAEENRRKEVIKAKKKADSIRITGEIPKKTCLCF